MTYDPLYVERLIEENDQLRAALASIYRLVHIATPKGTGAYTHFMRDFDEIRRIAKPFVGNGQSAK
jgi:hypothetical protein